jgi:hypothetical protein
MEEEQHKDEIIKLTEEVLEAKGMECDSRIAKISEERLLREILEEVRNLRRKRKRVSSDGTSILREVPTENEERQQCEEKEVPYIR